VIVLTNAVCHDVDIRKVIFVSNTAKVYEIDTPTLAIECRDDGRKETVTIPRESVVTLPAETDDTLVNVVWEGRTVMMFTQDLRARGHLVDSIECS
jgi:hypothetical protein